MNDLEREVIKMTQLAEVARLRAEQSMLCSGCENNGLYEDEIELGYPSPCTGCRRRAPDNYSCKKEEG